MEDLLPTVVLAMIGFVAYSCLGTVKGKETSRETYPQNTLQPTA